MTDNTSPVATLSARLPKGNGLTRAAEDLYHRRGDLVYGVVALRIEETGLDRFDVEKVKTSLERLELCFGPAASDVRDMMTRASADATTVTGQQSLFAGSRTEEEDDQERRSYVRDILEWGLEQNPALDTAALTDRWNSWHGGHYDARMDSAKVVPSHLRGWAIELGVYPDPEMRPAKEAGSGVDQPAFSDGEHDMSDADHEGETLNREAHEPDDGGEA